MVARAGRCPGQRLHDDGPIHLLHRDPRTIHDRPGETGGGRFVAQPSRIAFARRRAGRDCIAVTCPEAGGGLAELNGITHVTSDGSHVSFEYDSTQVLPARIRDRLEELGHPAKAGTEVQNPGDTAD